MDDSPQVLMCPTKHFRELITAVNQRLSLKRRQIMHIREMGERDCGSRPQSSSQKGTQEFFKSCFAEGNWPTSGQQNPYTETVLLTHSSLQLNNTYTQEERVSSKTVAININIWDDEPTLATWWWQIAKRNYGSHPFDRIIALTWSSLINKWSESWWCEWEENGNFWVGNEELWL